MALKGQALRDLVLERLAFAADEIFALFERTLAQYEEEVLRSKLMQQPRVRLYREDVPTVDVGGDIRSPQVTKKIKQEMHPPMNLQYPISAQDPQKDLQCSLPAEDNRKDLQYSLPAEDTRKDLQYSLPAEDTRKALQYSLPAEDTQKDLQYSLPAEDNRKDLQYPTFVEENRQNPTGKQSDREEPCCSSDLILNNNRPYSCSDTDDSDHWAEETTKRNGGEHNAGLMKDSAGNDVSCDSSFSSNTVTSNDGENRDIFLKCSHCYRYFRTMKALEKHLQLHVKKRPYKCQICNRSYTDRSNYNKHLRVHAEHKLFSCSICKRGFAQRLHFDEHMRIHTGEKPLCCSDCGRRFRHKNALIRHVFSQHSVEKPYPCPLCPKGFVEKKYFDAHMRKHTGEKPFMCPVCNKTFESQSYVSKHVLTHKVDGGIASDGLDKSFHGYLNVN